jgi:hypothetical protein
MNIVRVCRLCVVSVIALFALIFSACSGGGGGGGAPQQQQQQPKVKITGVAAAGAPIAGIVNIKGANGAMASTTIGVDGTYSFTDADLAALTAPYILWAQGSVNGKSLSMYSAGIADGRINITPITDFILRNTLGSAAETAYQNWSASAASVTAGTLSAAETKVQAQIQPLLDAAGVASGTDLVTGQFSADHTGLDKVLDVLSITYNAAGTTATVTNTVTGSSFSDNVTTAADDSNALPPSDTANTQAAFTDEQQINALFASLCQLYATTPPSYGQLSAWAAVNMSADFLEGGYTTEQQVSDWTIQGEGPSVGCTLTVALSSVLSNVSPTYTKGYDVTLLYIDPSMTSAETHETKVVYDGTKWMWHGDQKWLWYDIYTEARKVVTSTTTSLYSGYEVSIDDDYNYAYTRGVRSALITSETGTPMAVLTNTYPDTWYRIVWGPCTMMVGDHCYMDDYTITNFTDYMPYKVKLCSQEASVVQSNPSACTALKTYSGSTGRRPLFNTQVTNALFPSNISPNTHSRSALNMTSGPVTFNWTNAAQAQADWFDLWWLDGSNEHEYNQKVRGRTSVIADTTGTSVTPLWAAFYLGSYDYDYTTKMEYSLEWQFDQP